MSEIKKERLCAGCSSIPATELSLCETLYATYRNTANKMLDEVAVYITDTNRNYSHREILNLVECASAGFKILGVKEGSVVGIMLNGSIEEVITLFALNKLGAVCKYVDFMKSVPAMKHSLEETDIRLLVMDECFLPLDAVINSKKLPVIVANTSCTFENTRFIPYQQLLKETSVYPDEVKYIHKKPAVMINSSGTTGEPKPIVHTNYSINAAAQKMLFTDFPLYPGNITIKMIPSQIGLGLVTSMYTGLISGTEVVFLSGKSTPEFTEKLISFVDGFKKFRSDYHLKETAKLNLFTAPVFVRALIRADTITDLSFMGSIMAGGSKMTKEELDELELIAKQKGYVLPVCNGYGQNEMAGAVTLNQNSKNINGSAGLPTYETEILVVDPETKEPVQYGQVGLILERSTSEFLEYERQPQKTEDAYISLPDGSRWFNSCDLGYIESNGFLYITGRTTRVVVREDFKISLDEVERKIRDLPFIDDCAVIVSEYGGSIEQIAAFVKTEETSAEELKRMIESADSISHFEMPSTYFFVESLPYKNGKIDYKALEKSISCG